jgi:two-component system sensor histidine kinase RstB
MRATLERLAAALATQRELTGAVSHELRTPLARLRFALDALMDEGDAARRADTVVACERDIAELEALIDTSLTLARLDMGAVAAAPVPGDLGALLDQEVRALATLLEGKALGTRWTLTGPVNFDARLLPYALRNGLRNAARHARSRIELAAWVEHGRVFIAVDDDGQGVPPAQQEAVFQPFKRLEGERERRSRGWGLGLAIVRRVAQAHGGTARIETSPLGGARLRLVVPLQPARAPAAATVAPTAPTTRPPPCLVAPAARHPVAFGARWARVPAAHDHKARRFMKIAL